MEYLQGAMRYWRIGGQEENNYSYEFLRDVTGGVKVRIMSGWFGLG